MALELLLGYPLPEAGFPRAADPPPDGISIARIVLRVPGDAKLLVEVLDRISVIVHDELSGVEWRGLALGRHFPTKYAKKFIRTAAFLKKKIRQVDNI